MEAFDVNELLVAAVKHSPEAVVIMDLGSMTASLRPAVVFANNAFYALTGWEQRDFERQPYPALVGPNTQVDLIRTCVERIQQGERVETEVLLYRRDGTHFWAAVRAYALPESPGCCLLSMTDVTTRREALAAVDVLSAAVENALDFILITNVPTQERPVPEIVFANQAFLHAAGFRADELFGRPYTDIYSSRNRDPVMRAIQDNIEAGLPNYREILCRRKDGSDFWVEFVARPYVDREGRQMRISIARDITLRRRATNQISLLFRGLAESVDRVVMYEFDEGRLSVAFENEVSVGRGHRLIDGPDRGLLDRVLAETDWEEVFMERQGDGRLARVRFAAHVLRNISGPEAILTIEHVDALR